MNRTNVSRLGWSLRLATCCVFLFSNCAAAQESTDVEVVRATHEGPSAALEFEKSFRDPGNGGFWNPVPLKECENVTELTKDLWSKKHVLTDFKKKRTPDQIGVIVFVKTEYCCAGSRVCAVTTACMEKKSTPLVGRFRVYGGWIRNHPDHLWEDWNEWDEKLVDEYDFVQGPGARVVVMVPLWNGKMYQWQSTASDLNLSHWNFEAREGKTPALDQFLQTAIKYAPATPN